MSISSIITLTEVEGSLSVTLENSTLPERGVSVEVRQRSKVTWYPGATTASVQLFGTQEEPITFRGRLRDTWLETTHGALDITAQLRALLLSQKLLELVWAESTERDGKSSEVVPITRRGYLTRLTPIYDRGADIAYEIEFTPTEADEAEVATSAAEGVPLPSQFELSDLLDLIGDALEAVQTVSAVTNGVQAIL